MMNGTRFRLPRYVKKARTALCSDRALTRKQRRLLGRCLVLSPLGWRNVRRRNAHVAMGDTTTLRRRERVLIVQLREESSRAARRAYGL